MYNHTLSQKINLLLKNEIDIAGDDNPFYSRLIANASAIQSLYNDLYMHHQNGASAFDQLLNTVLQAHKNRPSVLKERDIAKEEKGNWFLSNDIAGMSLYVDRFCGSLNNLGGRLEYFEKLGVNLLHLMPLFESPLHESDGGYAVSDFRKVDNRFGTLTDLKKVQHEMLEKDMYLMLDVVLNHTSHQHAWARKAKQGDEFYQDFYYCFPDRFLPDQYDHTMPEIFPDSAPGNFTFVSEFDKWVMTVFHQYQWDLNYTNPLVLVEMLDIIFFYANLGVDILRIDAPAFIWKQTGTTSQNLPQAHTILRIIRLCVEVAAPGMALLGEAIVAPGEIMKYFGMDEFRARECDFAYNATHMALQWDALATGDTRVMIAAQHELQKKPFGASWIAYTRSHDDIGLGYEDAMIRQAGYDPYAHRDFLKDYFSGAYPGSPAKGALFAYNPKTGDARISGSLASLCGLEKALDEDDEDAKDLAIKKILLMQAHSFFIGGIPMLFYGDEAGYTNSYAYQNDPGKSYDNRWMHRPLTDWEKNKKIGMPGSAEKQIFSGTQYLLQLRKKLAPVADYSNITWLAVHNIHVAGYVRYLHERRLYCIFNFSNEHTSLTWFAFKEKGPHPAKLYDHWKEEYHTVGADHEYLGMAPYAFYLMESVEVGVPAAHP